MTGFVYLIESQNQCVKIGWSSAPHGRASIIALHSPVLTRLIAYWPGGRDEEAALHRRFADHRSHREWFNLTGPVAEFVESKRGTSVEVADWDSLTADGEDFARDRTRKILRDKAIAHWARRKQAAARAPEPEPAE